MKMIRCFWLLKNAESSSHGSSGPSCAFASGEYQEYRPTALLYQKRVCLNRLHSPDPFPPSPKNGANNPLQAHFFCRLQSLRQSILASQPCVGFERMGKRISFLKHSFRLPSPLTLRPIAAREPGFPVWSAMVQMKDAAAPTWLPCPGSVTSQLNLLARKVLGLIRCSKIEDVPISANAAFGIGHRKLKFKPFNKD